MPRDDSPNLTTAQAVCIGLILVAGVVLVVWTGYQYAVPPPSPRDLALEAKRLVRAHKPLPMSMPLKEILGSAESVRFETQPHSLLHQRAPDFRLANHLGETVALQELRKQGPVIVVFYLGYHCDHCVAQLFALQEELHYFRELGVQLVAISPDAPNQTAEKVRRFGGFGFPVVADETNAVAEQYRVFEREQAGKLGRHDHGTFVIDEQGKVVWARMGDEPFFHNPSLLGVVARLQGAISETRGVAKAGTRSNLEAGKPFDAREPAGSAVP